MFDSQTRPDCLVSTEIPSVANYLDLHIGKAVLQCGLHQNSCVMGLNFVPLEKEIMAFLPIIASITRSSPFYSKENA
ncbi:unnamed protein product [Camellia sinensis]